MTEFLCQKKLWVRLKNLNTHRNAPLWIATPYLGRSARALLGLRAKDVVVCAMTEKNVRSGSVCPKEVEWMQQKGVSVFTQDNLHAKVYLFGNTVVVCSANLSLNSHSYLDETGLLTSDSHVINEVRTWFKDRFSSPVTPAWLHEMMPLFPPLDTSFAKNNEKNASQGQDGERIWLGIMKDTVFPRTEDKYRLPCESAARLQLCDADHYQVLTTRWQYRTQVRFGDRLIQVWKENDVWTVNPHARVLDVVHFQTPKGQPRAYVCLEMPRSGRFLSYDYFRSKCGEVGLRLDDDPDWQEMIEITVDSQKRCLLGLTAFDPESTKD